MAQTRGTAPARNTQPRSERPGDPCVMVIFGAAGDLTRRKLIPALYNLAKQRIALARICSGRRSRAAPCPPKTSARRSPKTSRNSPPATVDPDLWEWFVRRCITWRGISTTRNSIRKLKETLAKVDQDHSTHGNYLYYLATAPDSFGPIVEQLGRRTV